MISIAVHASATLGASLVFAAAMELTFPLSASLATYFGFETYGLLLFLPHGVRVLCAYMFGWRSVLYLLPAIAYYATSQASTEDYILSLILGLCAQVSCVLAFYALGAIRAIENNFLDAPIRSDSLILAAIAGAAFNATSHFVIYDGSSLTASSIFVGDVFGFAVILILVMALARIYRRLPQ